MAVTICQLISVAGRSDILHPNGSKHVTIEILSEIASIVRSSVQSNVGCPVTLIKSPPASSADGRTDGRRRNTVYARGVCWLCNSGGLAYVRKACVRGFVRVRLTHLRALTAS